MMHRHTIDILWPLLHELGYVDSGHLGWYCRSGLEGRCKHG
jgi:hypothetical protein